MLGQHEILKLSTHSAFIEGNIFTAAGLLTESTARIAEVERASIWMFGQSRTSLHCIDLFLMSKQKHGKIPSLASASYPSYFSAVTNQRTVAAEDALRDPRTLELKPYLEKHEIGAMLDTGIRHGGKIIGVLCLEHIGGPRQWTAAEIAFAGAMADQFSIAVGNSKLRASIKSLERAEYRLRSILSNIPDLFTVVNKRGQITFTNRCFADQPMKTILGSRAIDWIDDKYKAKFKTSFDEILGGRASAELEMQAWGKPGQWFSLHMLPVTDGTKVSGIQIISTELTGAMRAQRMLEVAAQETFGLTGEAFIKTILRRIAIATGASMVFVGELTDDDLECQTHAIWSEGQFIENMKYALEGTPCETIVHMGTCTYSRELNKLFPQDFMLIDLGIEAYVGVPLWNAAGKAIGMVSALFKAPIPENKIISSTLSLFAGHISSALEKINTEKKYRASETARLETERRERKLAEERLRAIKEANRFKDQFLRNLSHELRTPMTAIIGFSNLLKSDPNMSPEIANYLQIIIDNAESELRLIDGVLDYSRFLAGKIDLEREKMDLIAAIEATIATLEPIGKLHGVETNFESIEKPIYIDADPDRVKQILDIVISNAIKFSPAYTRIRIRCEIAKHRKSSLPQALVTIKDQGKGISKDFLPKVFDPLEQEDSSITRRHGGLGLNLSIAKALIEAHNGNIRVDSKGPGLGSTFQIRLPLSSSQIQQLAG